MTWDEWEELKADARARSSQGTQINSAENGVQPDLVAHQDDLGAVGHQAFVLHGDLADQVKGAGMTSGHSDEGSSGKAAKQLTSHNFSLGGALAEGADRFGYQTDMLLQACAHISNHLDYTKSQHRRDDEKLEATFKDIYGENAVSVSEINKSFK